MKNSLLFYCFFSLTFIFSSDKDLKEKKKFDLLPITTNALGMELILIFMEE